MMVTDREHATTTGIDFVWCETCQHHHIPTIPTTTFACASECGFGAWNLSVAAAHADRHWGHIVYPLVHTVTPLQGGA